MSLLSLIRSAAMVLMLVVMLPAPADAGRLKIDVDAIEAEAVLSAIGRIADVPRSLLDRPRRQLTSHSVARRRW